MARTVLTAQHHQRYRELPGIRASQSVRTTCPIPGKVPRLTCARCAKPHSRPHRSHVVFGHVVHRQPEPDRRQSHRIALYCVDWDNAGRSQTVEIRDGTSNTLLDSRSLSGVHGRALSRLGHQRQRQHCGDQKRRPQRCGQRVVLRTSVASNLQCRAGCQRHPKSNGDGLCT